MANEENLIPFDQRSENEQREIARKGGIASGEARRKKRDIREALNAVLAMDCYDADLSMELIELGFEPTNEMALVLSVLKRAVETGDYRALETIMILAGEISDKEAAQIEKLQADTAKTKAETRFLTMTEEDYSAPVQEFVKALGAALSPADVFDPLPQDLPDAPDS